MKKEIQAKRVFIAEDDPDDLALLCDAISNYSDDAEVFLANDGVELMDLLDKRVPPPGDILFLDLNMPRKNGYECLADITRTGIAVPVVCFSTSTSPESMEKARSLGASGYVAKPTDYRSYDKLVSHILNVDWNNCPDNYFFSHGLK